MHGRVTFDRTAWIKLQVLRKFKLRALGKSKLGMELQERIKVLQNDLPCSLAHISLTCGPLGRSKEGSTACTLDAISLTVVWTYLSSRYVQHNIWATWALGLRVLFRLTLARLPSQDRLERQLDILQTQQIEIMESITALESEVQRLKRCQTRTTEFYFSRSNLTSFALLEWLLQAHMRQTANFSDCPGVSIQSGRRASARLGRLGTSSHALLLGRKVTNRYIWIRVQKFFCLISYAAGSYQGVEDIWSSYEKNTPPYHVTMKANWKLWMIEEKYSDRTHPSHQQNDLKT